MDPELPSRTLTLAFAHSWEAEMLPTRPLIKPLRCYTYPHEAEEVERGALEVMVQPAGGALKFLATFALGFADPVAPTGLWSCPAPDEICAIAGGYAYVVNTQDPNEFTQLALRPVLEVASLPAQNLLVFVGSCELVAWGAEGQVWQTPRLSSEGLRITEIQGDELYGFGWDRITDREVPFKVDLRTGEAFHRGSESAR
jgi:hypothetical protein